jgi:hypothetical protein
VSIDPISDAEAQTEADRLIRSSFPRFDATAAAAADALRRVDASSEKLEARNQELD